MTKGHWEVCDISLFMEFTKIFLDVLGFETQKSFWPWKNPEATPTRNTAFDPAAWSEVSLLHLWNRVLRFCGILKYQEMFKNKFQAFPASEAEFIWI